MLLVTALVLAGCGNDKKNTEESSGGTSESADKDLNVQPAILGVVEGNVYINSYAQIGCKLEDGWEIASAEQLQDLSGSIEESLKDTELGELAASIPQIVDMQAQNPSAGASVNVIYTQIGLKEMLAYRTMSEEKLVDSVFSDIDILARAYAQNIRCAKRLYRCRAPISTWCSTITTIFPANTA